MIQILKFISSLKCGILLIVFFSLMLILATIGESLWGKELNDLIFYNSFFFILIQILLFSNMALSLINRLYTPQKKLIGFYIIHTSMLLILAGGMITWLSGIDGTMSLQALVPNNKISLKSYSIKIRDQNYQVIKELPIDNLLMQKNINQNLHDIHISKIIPFAKQFTEWIDETAKTVSHKNKSPRASSTYTIFNKYIHESFTLSNHQEGFKFFGNYRHYNDVAFLFLSKEIITCLQKFSDQKFFIFDTEANNCDLITNLNAKLETSKNKNTFFTLENNQKFYPDFLPFPIAEHFTPNYESRFIVINKSYLENRNYYILTGSNILYFKNNSLIIESFKNKPILLKDKFNISQDFISYKEHPTTTFTSAIFNKDVSLQSLKQHSEKNIIAAKISNGINSTWITNESPLFFLKDEKEFSIEISKQELSLPFTLTLKDFKIDKDIDNKTIANYKSVVSLIDNNRSLGDFNIEMNNPLKISPFTFYQNSYYEDENAYTSILSINTDPGRIFKYLGSIFLILGIVIHYCISSKKSIPKINLKKNSLLLFLTFIGLSFGNIDLHASQIIKINSIQNCYNEQLDDLPILSNGRIKPLYVHAKESITLMAGKKFPAKIYTQMYCLLSFYKIEKDKASNDKNIVQLINFLNSTSQKQVNHYQSQNDIFIETYTRIVNGEDWMLPVILNNNVVNNQKISWINFRSYINQLTDNNNLQNPPLITKKLFNNYPSYKIHLELIYEKFRFEFIALILICISLVLYLFSSKNLAFANITSYLAIAIQISILIARTVISGRAPVTNMYESMLFTGVSAIIITQIITFKSKDKEIKFLGVFFNLTTLVMINFADRMLSKSIGPLVPVLRNNLWLSLHVTTIIIAYGALGLAWIAANYYLIIKFIFKKIYKYNFVLDFSKYQSAIYSSLKLGTIFLCIGILTGAVWADYSWGRFWGWDPKETWSLIVLLIYMLILHGKYVGKIIGEQFIFFSACAFLSVIMAWFGVNYILASGMHSYGFSSGGAVFVISFFIIQTTILLLAINAIKQRDC